MLKFLPLMLLLCSSAHAFSSHHKGHIDPTTGNIVPDVVRAPEISGEGVAAGLTLLIGALLVLRGRRDGAGKRG
jgi:hypothetical protein